MSSALLTEFEILPLFFASVKQIKKSLPHWVVIRIPYNSNTQFKKKTLK